LQIIATGAHLVPEFGLTYQAIEQDGFSINYKLEMLLSSDTAVGVTKSLGLGTIGFADAFNELQPHLVIILGDRFEMLAAAQAALIARIPVAHISGGDTSEGAYDEAIRHSITKMAHLHFVTNEISAQRVRQMGENPHYIYNVGSMGIDNIRRLRLLNREELEHTLSLKFKEKNILVTYHPVTLDFQSSADQFSELLGAIQSLGEEVGVIFTKTNADTDGRIINEMIDRYVSKHYNCRAFTSMGQVNYLSTLGQVNVVVGNSSSGLYEVPSFKIPTVNIGDRQKGRLKAASVIDSEPEHKAINEAIQRAFVMDCSEINNPYDKENSSGQILSILKGINDYSVLLKKSFFMG